MGIIEAFNIDLRILIAQFINFAILYFILKKFVWGKVVGFLEKRQSEIDQGLDDAQKAAKDLAAAEVEKEKIIIHARKQAAEIIGEAETKASELSSEIIFEAKDKVDKMIAKSEAQIAEDKEQMFKDVQNQLADIVVTGVQNVVDQDVDKNQVNQKYLSEGLHA
ncbi:MAG: F0F1 ATP synthase subunit B [Pseudomonadales bacterium]|jgi:F-type H+-transporting ATPase subunit b|nr:F0F1 ATP synthase subunit B [Pseudomonadales bacterium]